MGEHRPRVRLAPGTRLSERGDGRWQLTDVLVTRWNAGDGRTLAVATDQHLPSLEWTSTLSAAS